MNLNAERLSRAIHARKVSCREGMRAYLHRIERFNPCFDAAATCAALPFERLVPALRAMFIAGCEVPQRHVHVLRDRGSDVVTSLLMPAWQPGGFYAVKIVNVAPGNAALGLPGLHASVLLHDAATGAPLALIDGDQVTSRRTAAASALAASFLALPDARHLLVVGAGRVAALLPEAYRIVRPIERVSVWARRADAAEDLAAAARCTAAGRADPRRRPVDTHGPAAVESVGAMTRRPAQPAHRTQINAAWAPKQYCRARRCLRADERSRRGR